MVPGVIGYIPEYPGVTGTPPEAIGPHRPNWWKRRGIQGAAARPSPPKSELDKEGAPPPFLSSSLLPSPLLVQQGREGVLLPVGVGLLLARLLLAGRTFPPCSFIYEGRGHPRHNN